MKIYAISGLGADERVFQYLTLDHELVPVKWITPKPKEPIIAYSKRLIKKYGIDKDTNFGILGVSFGGLIAIEISKLIEPTCTILISSIATRNELSGLIKLAGKLKLFDLIPTRLLRPPKIIAQFLFGAKQKMLLNAILEDTDLPFVKWAIRELANWENQHQLKNLIKIGGTNDKLLPPKGSHTILIDKGAHFMVVDRAKEISDIINEIIKVSYSPLNKI